MAGLGERTVLTGLGALTAAALYLLFESLDRALLSGPIAVVLGSFIATAGGVTLLLAGRLSLRSAGFYAVIIGLSISALLGLCALRWPDAEDVFNTPWPSFAAFHLALMPLPYILTSHETGDPFKYERLFENTGTLIARVSIALLFTLALWLMIWLADSLLRGIGQRFIGDFFTYEVVPYLITGAAFGFALAIAREIPNQNPSPLGLWLLRLLLPVLTGFSAIFILAAVTSGFDESYFPDIMLLFMAWIGLLLSALAVERSPEKEANGVLALCAKIMGPLAAVMAILALWVINRQIPSSGWTPDLIAQAVIAIVLALYGLGYGLGLVFAADWGRGVRRVNLALAGLVYLLAFLWLTPFFNAEALSARSALSIYEKGEGEKHLSSAGLQDLGHAGLAAQEEILQLAQTRGDQSTIARLKMENRPMSGPAPDILAEMLEELRLNLPVTPISAQARRDSYLELMLPWELEDIRNSCALRSETGQAGCVMVIADLLPHLPGEEAVLVLDRGGWISLEGLYLEGTQVQRREIHTHEGEALSLEAARALISQWQKELPPIAPAQINQLGLGREGLFFTP